MTLPEEPPENAPKLSRRERLELLERAFDALPIGVTLTDPRGRIVYTNPAEAALHGYSIEELRNSEARRLVPPEFTRHLTPDQIASLRPWKRERPNLRRDGTTFPAQLASDVVRSRDGRPLGIITTCEDISERKRAEEMLMRRAFFDALTGLPNRALFRDRLYRAWERTLRSPSRRFALLFLDVDRFKSINDNFGHTVGDELLAALARRLEDCLRPGDSLARLGGDEFALLLDPVRDLGDAVQVAERLCADAARPFLIGGCTLHTSFSVGIAISDRDARDPDGLLRKADAAMYQAKALGRNRYELSPSGSEEDRDSVLGIGTALRAALVRTELEVHYQPIVRISRDALVALEALVRWRHPTRGLLLPGAFVPQAEENGIIDAVDRHVLRRACENVRTLHATHPGLVLSVNVSARQFRKRELPDVVRQILGDTGVSPQCLQLELTESALMEDLPESARVLARLRDLGICICIDDFGTGHASFEYLKRFPVTGLKIDRSFVRCVDSDPKDAAIVRAVIDLAHSLSLNLVAEGVETIEQLDFLRNAGCDVVQGFLLGRPAHNARLRLRTGLHWLRASAHGAQARA